MTEQITFDDRRATLLACLSPRQHAVIMAVLSGATDDTAARTLHMAIDTFRTQLKRAAFKLGLTGARRPSIFVLFYEGASGLPPEALRR